MFCWLYLQVILATNIAESSITVPDIKYGECTLYSTKLQLYCYWMFKQGPQYLLGQIIIFVKNRIVFIKSSLQLGQSFKTWISPFSGSSHIFLSPISVCFKTFVHVHVKMTYWSPCTESWSANIRVHVSTCRVWVTNLAALQATV